MLAGLTIAREASFAIGTSIFAQPELNVPMTPMIDSSSTYFRAFAARRLVPRALGGGQVVERLELDRVVADLVPDVLQVQLDGVVH